MFTLAPVCKRVGVTEAVGNQAMLAAYPWPQDGPWAKKVKVNEAQYIVGQGDDGRYFVCFPFPFKGHADDVKTVFPINSEAELLVQVGGPKFEEITK